MEKEEIEKARREAAIATAAAAKRIEEGKDLHISPEEEIALFGDRTSFAPVPFPKR